MGEAAGGLEILKKFPGKKPGFTKGFWKRQYQPLPRIKEAAYLTENFKINAMIDLSDGLFADLSHILAGSGVEAKMDMGAVPIPLSVKKAASILKVDPLLLAAGKGEDYELLFTLSPGESSRLLSEKLFFPVSLIGRIVSPGKGDRLPETGYRHF